MVEENRKNPADDRDEWNLKTSEFIRFLTVFASKSVCPCCGGTHYATLSDDKGCYVFHNEAREADGTAVGLPTYAVGCTNCGYLRHHVARVVQEKLANMPAEEPGNPENERG